MFSRKWSGSTIVGVVFGVCAGFFLSVSTTHAITLIPPTLDLEVQSGETYRTEVKLYNERDEPITYYTETTPFGAVDETGTPFYDFANEPSGLSNWIVVDEGPFTLGAGERISVPVTITVPADAEPGGHYAVLFFSDQPTTSDAPGTVTVSSKVGILLFVRTAGEVTEAGMIKEFTVGDDGTVFTRLPVYFMTRFGNTGNVHLRPAGDITVRNMFGRVTTTLDVNAARGATLPGTTRRYETVWLREEVTGGDSFWDQYREERANFGFGKYTATVVLSGGTDGSVNGTATTTFWILPWHVMLVWLVVAIVVAVLLWLLIRRYNRWLVNRAMRQQQQPTGTPSADVKK